MNAFHWNVMCLSSVAICELGWRSKQPHYAMRISTNYSKRKGGSSSQRRESTGLTRGHHFLKCVKPPSLCSI